MTVQYTGHVIQMETRAPLVRVLVTWYERIYYQLAQIFLSISRDMNVRENAYGFQRLFFLQTFVYRIQYYKVNCYILSFKFINIHVRRSIILIIFFWQKYFQFLYKCFLKQFIKYIRSRVE